MKDGKVVECETFVMIWEKAYKTVVIISADKNQRRDGFYNVLTGSGRVWGEFKWHDVNRHLAFVNKVLYFQAP